VCSSDLAHQELQRRHFSRTIRSQESEDLSFLNLEGEIVERPTSTIAPEAQRIIFREPQELDCGFSLSDYYYSCFEIRCSSQSLACFLLENIFPDDGMS
jgi:hypothetical protein